MAGLSKPQCVSDNWTKKKLSCGEFSASNGPTLNTIALIPAIPATFIKARLVS
jgi:hypothetical protein